MALKNTSRIGGAVHAVPALELLPDDDCNILVVSSRTLYMLANMAEMEATWHARFAKTVLTGGLVDTVETTDPEADFVDQVIRNFRLEVIPVTCDFSELAAAINNVAAALGNQSGCDCPQQGVVCIDAADIQPDGTQNPPATEGEYGPVGTEYPEGFDSLEDYLAYKCEAANAIMDGLVNVLRGLSPGFLGVAVLGAVSAYLAAATSTAGVAMVIPPLAFVAILAALAGMLFLGAQFYLVLNSLADALEENRQEIICRLYQAQNTTSAINSAIDEIEDIIEAVVIASSLPGAVHGAVQAALSTVISEMWNTSTMNQLFQLVIDISYAGADCSMCGETAPCEYALAPAGTRNRNVPTAVIGSGVVANDGEEFTIDAVERTTGSFWYIMLATNEFLAVSVLGDPDGGEGEPCGCDSGSGMTLTRIGGPTTGWAQIDRIDCTGGGTFVEGSGVSLSGPFSIAGIGCVFYQRNAPFSLTFRIDP